MPNCIIVTGNIGCGKSTLASFFQEKKFVVISRDSFRYSIGNGKYIFHKMLEPVIWKTELYMFKLFVDLGVDIYVDEVGVTPAMRKRYIDVLKKHKNYKIISIEMPRLSKDKAVARRLKTPHGQPDKALWELVWKKFDLVYESPKKSEGFHKLYKV